MLPLRTIHKCYLCNGLKLLKNHRVTSRNVSNAEPETIGIPENLCNLAKQLNIKNTALARVVNNNQDKLKLYDESRWTVLFDYLGQYDFKTSDLLEMVDSNPDILSVNRNSLHKCMSAWTNFRFDDKKLRQLLIAQPSCLLLNDKELLSRLPKLLAYVGNKQNRLLELISYSPNVLFDNWEHIETKLDYIMLHMELGPTQFVTTTVMSSTLFDIKCRHDFLVKLGMYKKRDPKSNVNQLSDNNPTLKKIIETSNKQFAVKVAGVTAEEFFVFKKLFKEQMHDDSEDDSDNENY